MLVLGGSPQSLNSTFCTMGSNEELTSSFEMQQQELRSLLHLWYKNAGRVTQAAWLKCPPPPSCSYEEGNHSSFIPSSFLREDGDVW